MLIGKNILIPIDYSECSINALKYAADISITNNAKLTVLNISDSGKPNNESHEKKSSGQRSGYSRVEDLLANVRYEFVRREGNITKEILRIQQAFGSELIVMGTQGAHNLNRKLFGTNTTEIITKADCAVMAVPLESVYSGFKRVVLATDMHRKNLEMVESAINMIQAFEPELMLLHVNGKTDPRVELEYALSEIPKEVRKHINYEKTSMYVSSFKKVDEGIAHFIKRKKADLLIMITEHRSLFKGLVDKSETKKMAFQTTIPLLAVPNIGSG